MPRRTLSIDFGCALADAVGPAHGVEPRELQRVEKELSTIVATVEKERAAGQHRYRDLSGDRAMLREVQAAVKRCRAGCDNLVVLGIGGSALGNIALQTALNPAGYNLLPRTKRGGPRLFVIDNVDPAQFGDLLDLLQPELKRTLFNVISKSGETAETAAQFLIVRDLLKRKLGRKAAERIVVTTDPQSGTMRDVASAAGYRTLPVPPGVGGRWSVLSPVGLFSAGMCGIDIAGLLAGAAEMDRRIRRPGLRGNPAAVLAALLHAFYLRGKRMHVMMPYSDRLKDLADWYRQLWAESLGKRVDRTGAVVNVGPTPIRALGATDQHSQVQLYREGPNDKVYVFVEVQDFGREVTIPRAKDLPEAMAYLGGAKMGALLNAERCATEYALVASGRPCLTIRMPRVDAHTVGQFILLWEAATTLTAALLNIDAYDQPAVQTGKEFTFALMGRVGYDAQRKAFRAHAARSGKHVV